MFYFPDGVSDFIWFYLVYYLVFVAYKPWNYIVL